jgi:hypothetical protein
MIYVAEYKQFLSIKFIFPAKKNGIAHTLYYGKICFQLKQEVDLIFNE